MMYLNLLVVVMFYANSVAGQRRLGVTFDRMEFTFINRTIVETYGQAVYVNRTTKAINMNATYFKELPDDSKFKATVYTFRGNVYKLTAIQMDSPLRDAINFKYFDFVSLFKACKPPLGWPIQVHVTYTLTNFLPDMSKLPSYLPEYRFKFVIEMWWGKEMPYVCIDVFGNVIYHY